MVLIITKKLILFTFFLFSFVITISMFNPTLNSNGITNINKSTSDIERPRSIILFIGDGMGYEHMKLAQWIEVGENGTLEMQKIPYNTSMTTLNVDGEITDSAASGTALATGHKTLNGYVGLDADGQEVPNIAEIVKKELHKSIGIVSTDAVTHATPATFLTHVDSRYADEEIAKQIVEDQIVDVLFGGDMLISGSSHFEQYEENFTANGYSFVRNRTELNSLESGKAVGLFAEYHYYENMYPREVNRNRTTTPSLAEMTSKAIELLAQDPNGFFLMVEGAQIDWGGHENDAAYVAIETIELDEAIAEAMKFAELDGNTMVINTADHETGGLSTNSNTLDDILPTPVLSEEDNELLRIERVLNVSVSWTSDYHTATMVPFYAYNYGNSLDNYSIIDNTDVFDIMLDYFYSDNSHPNVEFNELSDNILNQTYITLNFTIDRFITELYYSINSDTNISITVNETKIELTSLEDGNYTVDLYAIDSLNNVGKDTINFTIKTIVEHSDTSSLISETSSNSSDQSSTTSNKNTFSIDFLTAIFSLSIPLLYKKRR